MCDCIKVTYQLVGEDPVTVEVWSVADEYTTDEFKILKDGTNWIVQAIEETPVVGCDCIKFNYTPTGGSPQTLTLSPTGTLNGKNKYDFLIAGVAHTVFWSNSAGSWNFNRVSPSTNYAFFGVNNTCPFGTYTLLNLLTFTAVSITQCTELVTYATLSEDTPCPFGTYTIEEGSIFESFVVSECTPPRKTITYSKISEGWNSFWSYSPDWMTEMNSIFYTFKGGELWKHNVNTTRNNFYGQQYPSSIQTIFNTDPLTVKVFNTVSLNSTHPWTANVYTNINDGSVDYTYFIEKEGQWYAYIRRFDNTIDVKALSTQGVGLADSVDSTTPSAVVLDFLFKLDSSISIGDKLYKNSSGTLVLVGTITNLSSNSITVDTTTGSIPLTTDFLICVKNSQAESFGARGYYMNINLENDLTEQVKLFAVGTSLFKSFM
jgi:hypothetical protein